MDCVNGCSSVKNSEQLKNDILRLKKEKNAVILAHYYVDGAIQDIADYVGDSLALAQRPLPTAPLPTLLLCAESILWERL